MLTRAKQRSMIAFIGGAVTVMIGIAALVGWLIGRMSLAGAVDGYSPVAPNSAFCLILLGAALSGAPARWPRPPEVWCC